MSRTETLRLRNNTPTENSRDIPSARARIYSFYTSRRKVLPKYRNERRLDRLARCAKKASSRKEERMSYKHKTRWLLGKRLACFLLSASFLPLAVALSSASGHNAPKKPVSSRSVFERR